MFNKLLMWLFRKRLKKLSPEDKQRVRELVGNKKQETKSDTTEKKQKPKKTKKENQKMADEKEVKKETEEKVEKKEETKPVAEGEKVENEKEVKTEETETADKVEPTEQVVEVEETGNARPIEDYALKEDVMQLIQALNAKLDAVVKENSDLKEKLAGKDDELHNKENELNGMREKYENKDFGNTQRQGIMTKDKSANETFEEYAKSFL